MTTTVRIASVECDTGINAKQRDDARHRPERNVRTHHIATSGCIRHLNVDVKVVKIHYAPPRPIWLTASLCLLLVRNWSLLQGVSYTWSIIAFGIDNTMGRSDWRRVATHPIFVAASPPQLPRCARRLHDTADRRCSNLMPWRLMFL